MIPGVPYDAEIEYLESSGTQYIDTGVYFAPTYTVVIEASLVNPATVSQYKGLFGVSIAPEQRFALAFYNGKIRQQWGSGKGSLGNNYRDSDYVGYEARTAYSCAGNGYYINGSLDWTPNANMDTLIDTAWLFKVHAESDYEGVPARVFSFSVINGGKKILDLIPVRVGTIGYMYDRVSRKLFGTPVGAFVLGPDVATPIMGLYEMKKFYNARDYIQDGLVAIWDGIENAAWGVHDSSLKEWADLTGNESPLIAWTKNDLLFSGMGAYNFRGYIQNNVISRDYSAHGYTLELVAPNGWKPRDNITSGNSNMVGSAAWQSNDYYRFNSFGTDGGAPHTTGAYASVTRPYCGMSVQPTGQGSAYVHGDASILVLQMTTASTPLKLNGNARIRIGAGNGGVRYGPICRIAVYSRALTDAEIAHNYQIDKARFNLP